MLKLLLQVFNGSEVQWRKPVIPTLRRLRQIGLKLKASHWAGEMTQCFKALPALPEDEVQFSAPIGCLTTICKSNPRTSVVTRHAHGAQTHMYIKTTMHIK